MEIASKSGSAPDAEAMCKVPTARAGALQVTRRLAKHGLGVRRLNAACAAELDAFTLAWRRATTENRDPMKCRCFGCLVPLFLAIQKKTTAPLKPTALATDKQGAVCQLAERRQDVVRGDAPGQVLRIDRQGTAARTMPRLRSCNAFHTTRSTRAASAGNAIREAGLNVRAMR
jgi:hypothetical protein